MKFEIWRDKTWQKRLIVLATLVVILSIASHPELRLLVPVIDVMGVDVFLLVVGLQSWAQIKPLAESVHKNVVLPICTMLYRGVLFLFGYVGPYVNARIASRQ